MGDNFVAGFPPLSELYLKDPTITDPQVQKRGLNRMHHRVRLKLRLRAQGKASVEEEQDKVLDCQPTVFSSAFCSRKCMDILLSFSKEQFVFSDASSWPPQEPGFVDLFSGKKGFAKACVRHGCPWVLTFEIKDGPHCDLTKPEVRNKIEFLLSNGVFRHLSAAPTCSSFSRAITRVFDRANFLLVSPMCKGLCY